MPDFRVATGRSSSPHPEDRPPRWLPAQKRDELSCVGPQATLFFSDDPGEVEQAKSLCASCPRRRPCLAGAIARREPWGVWGGELFQAGAVVQHKRPRGRPRKHRPAEGPRGAVTASRQRKPQDGSPRRGPEAQDRTCPLPA